MIANEIPATATTTQDLDALRKHARKRFEATNKEIKGIAKANANLLKAQASYDCTGELDLSAIIINTSVRIEDMRFDDGSVLEFDGSAWGIGLGATGKSIGAGTFNVPPSQLLREDKILIQVFFLTVGIGGVEITFWNEYEYLGIFACGSIGAGAGSFGGDGKFSQG
jgi:hypothetical protein